MAEMSPTSLLLPNDRAIKLNIHVVYFSFDQRKKAWYYFNYENGTSQWEHPLDGVYRDLVKKTRQESLSSGGDDISSLKDDLKSLDDNSGYSGALLRRATSQMVPYFCSIVIHILMFILLHRDL
jgi:hypothetical protein